MHPLLIVLLLLVSILLFVGGYTFFTACKRRKELPWLIEEEIKKTATTYQELKEGDLFRITVSKSDLRVYRRDKEGSTQIVDSYGMSSNYKSYPYFSMTVYKIERR